MGTTGAAREDIAQIFAMDREFMEAVAARDAYKVAAFYADDARIMMPGRPAAAGAQEVLKFWQEALSGPVQGVVLNTTYAEVSGGLAYAVGTNRIKLSFPGQPPREECGKYVAVYRRTSGGEWKVVVDAYSNDA